MYGSFTGSLKLSSIGIPRQSANHTIGRPKAHELTRFADLFDEFADGFEIILLSSAPIFWGLPDKYAAVSRNKSMACSVSGCREEIEIPVSRKAFNIAMRRSAVTLPPARMSTKA